MRRRVHQTEMRYAPLPDLDYIYSDVGFQNYAWFQEELTRVAEFLTDDQEFTDVFPKLQPSPQASKGRNHSPTSLRTSIPFGRVSENIGRTRWAGDACGNQPDQLHGSLRHPPGIVAIRAASGFTGKQHPFIWVSFQP